MELQEHGSTQSTQSAELSRDCKEVSLVLSDSKASKEIDGYVRHILVFPLHLHKFDLQIIRKGDVNEVKKILRQLKPEDVLNVEVSNPSVTHPWYAGKSNKWKDRRDIKLKVTALQHAVQLKQQSTARAILERAGIAKLKSEVEEV